MRRGERSYLKGDTFRNRAYFLYLQCSSHFRMRLFSAKILRAVARHSFQMKEKSAYISFIAHVRALAVLWSELRMKSLHWRIIR